ncbi:MAG: class I SAM-dependent methyltransferase [Rhodoferax sp.]
MPSTTVAENHAPSVAGQAGDAAQQARSQYQALHAAPSTLRIPLAARALGDALYPQVAVGDRYAAGILAALGDDGQQWLQDRTSIYGILARTGCFRDQARAFVRRHPGAHVVSLGCGLSDYSQWVDDGKARFTHADLPEVLAIRQAVLPPQGERQRLCALDLGDAQWWERLELPERASGESVFLLSEGVFMYLRPEQVRQVLQTFAERAPAGSELVLDAMCWLSAGRERLHRSVRQTDARFLWGPRRASELAQWHPRLRLCAAHEVMRGYSLPHAVFSAVFGRLTGVPLYAVYVLQVQDTA